MGDESSSAPEEQKKVQSPKEVLAAAVSDALNDTKERLLAIWRRLPLWFQIIVIAFGALCALAWHYREFTIRNWRVLRLLPSVALNDRTRFALSSDSRDAVRAAIVTLEREGASDLAASARYPPIVLYEAFSAAQTMISMRQTPAAVFTSIELQKDKTCHCWAQFSNMPPNIATSAWVLRAYALARRSPGVPEVQFLLTRQREGGWPLYDETRDHSTFATAHSVLALHDLIEAKVLPPAQLAEAEVALNRGIGVLRGSNVGGRWRYYPERSDSDLSDADSGLVLYALHRVGKGDSKLDKLWLDSLPHDHLGSRDDEVSNARWLYRLNPQQPPLPDPIRHLRLPWILAGTVSAYPSGSVWQRARAGAFIEEILDQPDGSSFLPPENFRRSQLLIALRYLEESARPR
ncbi:MAG TPA: hypothetical protein VKB93_05590 [Thermoanaerobaculia bacterium]|nr:hypothetical protein [Thermoanaerobaculia bacterium]